MLRVRGKGKAKPSMAAAKQSEEMIRKAKRSMAKISVGTVMRRFAGALYGRVKRRKGISKGGRVE